MGSHVTREQQAASMWFSIGRAEAALDTLMGLEQEPTLKFLGQVDEVRFGLNTARRALVDLAEESH